MEVSDLIEIQMQCGCEDLRGKSISKVVIFFKAAVMNTDERDLVIGKGNRRERLKENVRMS